MFGLLYAEEVRDLYNNKIRSIRGLNSLENRQYDIWAPMLIIASLVDKENNKTLLSDSLVSYEKKQAEMKSEKDRLENTTSRILYKFDEILKIVNYAKNE